MNQNRNGEVHMSSDLIWKDLNLSVGDICNIINCQTFPYLVIMNDWELMIANTRVAKTTSGQSLMTSE